MKWINAEQKVTVTIYDEELEEDLEKIMTVEELLDAYTNEGCPTVYSNPEREGTAECMKGEENVCNEIKHCPFCGDDELEFGEVHNPDAWWDSALRGEYYGYVKCGCGAIIKENSLSEAVKKWNRRASDGSDQYGSCLRYHRQKKNVRGKLQVAMEVEKLPSEEPDQKTGKWTKETKHYKDQFQEFDYYTIKCSVCGLAPEKNWHLTHYCPNCGSRMLEEWEEE